jgi:thiol-disulfide isomerase/thioredoxin
VLTALVIGARVFLAGVFAVAAVTKLADRAGTGRAVGEFGAPERAVGALAIALPLAELTVAGLLLPASTAVVGAFGAVTLLALFTSAIAWTLARGRTPDCHCFGQLHSAPASRRTLARNSALFALALFALAGSMVDEPPSAVAWLGDLAPAETLALTLAAVTAAVMGVGTVAVVSLLRSYGRVLTRLERVEVALARAGFDLSSFDEMPELGLEPGTRAPELALRSSDGGEVRLESLLAPGAPALLVFTSPGCAPCRALLPTAVEWQRSYADALTIAFVTDGPAEDAAAEASEHRLGRVLLDPDRRVYDAYEANGTPSAVLVAPDGTIASWVASGADWITQLVEGTVSGGPGEGLPVGTKAPALELPALAGGTMSTSDLRGRDALLLFWNPRCGFCRSMREALGEWETSANGVHPRLVVVSSGDAESTREEGFRSQVLLDEDFAAGAAFGANGTPMAVLIDAEGRIASPVVAGAEAVLALAQGRR